MNIILTLWGENYWFSKQYEITFFNQLQWHTHMTDANDKHEIVRECFCHSWPGFLSCRKSIFSLSHIFGLAALLTGTFATLHAQSDKISTSLLNLADETEIIIHFDAYPGFEASELPSIKEEKGVFVYNALRRHAGESQFYTIETLKNEGIEFRSYCIANVIFAKVSPDQLGVIARNKNVRKITPNEAIELDEPILEHAPINRSAGPEWGLVRIGADSAWALGFRGQGVVIGGEDTGYDWTHPAISGAYRGTHGDSVEHSYNWHDAIHELSPLHNDTITDPANTPCGINGLMPCDDSGHGTHTMGTMLGLDGENIIGVAPDARWMGVRCMDRGWGSPITYIEGFEWFLAPTDINGGNPDPAQAPHVINNSWRCPEIEGCNSENFDLMRQAIINLKAAGIVVVVSAGNEGNLGCSSITSPPSMFAESFAVGAMRSNDTIAGFSSRGPVLIDSFSTMKPDVTAPGVGVRSAWLDSIYKLASGTSMSGPHVAGAVALIISANPDLAGQVEVIEDILRTTAIPVFTDEDCGGDGGQSPNNVYGYGRVDVVAAIEKALVTTAVNDIAPREHCFKIFPNPSNGTISLNMGKGNETVDVRIVTMQGRVVYAISDYHPGTTIDLSHLPGGVYIVFVNASTGSGAEYGARKLILVH
jgi:serine protease AprX